MGVFGAKGEDVLFRAWQHWHGPDAAHVIFLPDAAPAGQQEAKRHSSTGHMSQRSVNEWNAAHSHHAKC